MADTADDRTARIALAIAGEPDDAFTGRLVSRLGAVETLRLVGEDEPIPGADFAETQTWRERLGARLSNDAIARTLDESERLGLRVLIPTDPDWPAELAALRDRAPVALWVKGDPSALATSEPKVTLTGARAATSYGEHVVTELARGTAEHGQVVVSGGAYGIDIAAHRAAITASGRTIAVMPSGLDRLYPSGNQSALERVATAGALVSELPPGASPTKWRFLARARLLAALSNATVIVEAGYRSGSLRVAGEAAKLRRQVGAVPGAVTSAASTGCHRLLREGTARVVTDIADLRALTHPAPAAPAPELSRTAPTRIAGRSGLSR